MDLFGLLLRIAVVFALLAAVLWCVQRTEGGRRLRRADDALQVLGSTRLGKGSSVAVVRIGSCAYALGVTEHTVTLLTETPLPDAAPVPAPVTGPVPLPAPVPAARPVMAEALTGAPDAGAVGAPDAVGAPGASDASRGAARAPHERPSFAEALREQARLKLPGLSGRAGLPGRTGATAAPHVPSQTRSPAADGPAATTSAPPAPRRDATTPSPEQPCPPRPRTAGAAPARGEHAGR